MKQEQDYLKRKYTKVEEYLELALETTDPDVYDLESYVNETVSQVMSHFIDGVDDETFEGMLESVHKTYRGDIEKWYRDNK